MMKVKTVTGESIRLSGLDCLTLQFVIPCGQDYIAEVQLYSGNRSETSRRARVFVSENPGVATLMDLAIRSGDLKIVKV